MLSNAETMAPELQSTQPAVSAKRDKKKKKSEAVVVDEQPAVSSGNQTRPDSPQGDEAKSKNLYVEAISKRLRNLKKKLGKLEQYDAVPKDQLNVDQQQALSKRPELQATFKELEDIVKQFNLLDAEEIKAEKVAREQREKEEQAKIERAVHDEKRQNDINTSTLLRTIIALNRLTAIPQTVQLSPEQWQTLVYFKQVLTGEGTLDIRFELFLGLYVGVTSTLPGCSVSTVWLGLQFTTSRNTSPSHRSHSFLLFPTLISTASLNSSSTPHHHQRHRFLASLMRSKLTAYKMKFLMQYQ
ncbi:hypothetical protein M427DRAFT_312838 [Gonapodya prolifera JEL478]|uniref:Uncharacterized protein n=1 Tax=Gonapodya prolifera (strain JEL478) TaxID=1344416 RepID=A0A139AWU1_GONPJ|nr:hypothetical protein M427DRAFT_312838 [Gonapodya prolifera JEL478]|eukprot:KXS21169.1 hypothetical protein M427DRAFT_312838 [Gonapodya prolifera JEL478]